MSITLQRAANVTGQADEILTTTAILQNSYFQALVGGTMSKEQFVKTQQEFYFAVAYFSRPMARLLSRMEDPHERLDILHNVVEEHGEFNPSHFHEATFRSFLAALNSKKPQQPGPAVLAFNAALMGVCNDFPVEVGIALLGIIEYAFSDISACIGRSVVARGFIEEEKLTHYSLHADLDKEHAQEFFLLLEERQKDPEVAARTQMGLKMGAYIFNRLYEDLLFDN